MIPHECSLNEKTHQKGLCHLRHLRPLNDIQKDEIIHNDLRINIQDMSKTKKSPKKDVDKKKSSKSSFFSFNSKSSRESRSRSLMMDEEPLEWNENRDDSILNTKQVENDNPYDLLYTCKEDRLAQKPSDMNILVGDRIQVKILLSSEWCFGYFILIFEFLTILLERIWKLVNLVMHPYLI